MMLFQIYFPHHSIFPIIQFFTCTPKIRIVNSICPQYIFAFHVLFLLENGDVLKTLQNLISWQITANSSISKSIYRFSGFWLLKRHTVSTVLSLSQQNSRVSLSPKYTVKRNFMCFRNLPFGCSCS